MDERGKLSTISDWEDRFAKEESVKVTFVGVDFESKASGISNSVSRSSTTGYSRESGEQLCLLPCFIKEFCACERGYILCDLELSMAPAPLEWTTLSPEFFRGWHEKQSPEDCYHAATMCLEACFNPQGSLWILDRASYI